MKTMTRFIAFTALIILSGCVDLETIKPTDSVPADDAINNITSAEAAITGLYDALQIGFESYDVYLGLAQIYSDEADAGAGTNPEVFPFGSLNVFPSNPRLLNPYHFLYDAVNVTNNILEALPPLEDPTLTPEALTHFLAEARFGRAVAYFYLVNYFGDVPLVLTPTRAVTEELNAANVPVSAIYETIIEDLMFAAGHLTSQQTRRATKQAALALLSRVHLYQGKWQGALDYAEEVLGPGFDLSAYPYLEDEIFFLGFTPSDGNILSFLYGPPELGGRHDLVPTDKILNAYEPGDVRKELSVDASLTITPLPYVLKYDDFSAAFGAATDPIMMIRHAEVVLIAAEAAAELGDFSTANTWYNQVRQRAGLPEKTLTPDNYVELILQERFIELSFEGPHRWFDLRRRGRDVEEIENYLPCHRYWPLPQLELDVNPNLQQNDCCNC